MPYIYLPDNTPSRNYSGNSQSSTFGPTIGSAGSDPRERGRKRSRSEIEESSREAHIRKKERLAKIREEVAKQKEAEQLAKESKSSSTKAAKSAEALANNPEAARREMMRQQTAAQDKAKKEALAARGGKAERLTLEQSAAKGKAEKAAREARASEQYRASPAANMEAMLRERNTEPSGLMEAIQASEQAGAPYVASAVPKMFKYAAPATTETAPASAPMGVPSQQPEIRPELNAIYQGMAATAPKKKRNLISDAFSVPSGETPGVKFSPRREAEEIQRGKFPSSVVPSLPNRIADQIGETVSGIVTRGPAYFNVESSDIKDANAMRQQLTQDKKRQAEIEKKKAELDELLAPMSRYQMNQYTPAGGYIGAPTNR